MSKTGFGQMYRQLSSKLLDLVVTPHVLGEVPTESTVTEQNTTDSNTVICYVLQNYSRSNALVVDGETRRLHLKPALDAMSFGSYQEKNSVLFLHQNENNLFNTQTYPPRLLQLIEALEQTAEVEVQLVPVTVLRGRSPDKEDSWFKL